MGRKETLRILAFIFVCPIGPIDKIVVVLLLYYFIYGVPCRGCFEDIYL